MRLSEKYDQIINDIEDLVIANESQLASNHLLTQIANKHGYYGTELRDFNAIFLFMTDMRPLEYIKRRRLMYAYKFLLSQDKFNVHEVYAIAGYDNQNSFGKSSGKNSV